MIKLEDVVKAAQVECATAVTNYTEKVTEALAKGQIVTKAYARHPDPRVRIKNKAYRALVWLEAEFHDRPTEFRYAIYKKMYRKFMSDASTNYAEYGGPELLDYLYKCFRMFHHIAISKYLVELANTVDAGTINPDIKKASDKLIRQMSYDDEDRARMVMLWTQLMIQRKFVEDKPAEAIAVATMGEDNVFNRIKQERALRRNIRNSERVLEKNKQLLAELATRPYQTPNDRFKSRDNDKRI